MLTVAASQFISGQVQCVVATSAFGMGVDKSDVRVVVHIGLPTSVEEYHQQVGGGGVGGWGWGPLLTVP